MKRFFNTIENAKRHLEYRKACAYKRIEERGDKVLVDNSFVFKTRIWKYDKEKHYAYETNIEKWEVFLAIITQGLVDDLSKIKVIDYEAELHALIPFTEDEKIIRKQSKIEKIEHKYKTIDNKDNTINKDI
jgi:hypothetical protein